MAKLAIYNDEAKRLYVQEGLSLDAIVGILGNKVSRKTLYNWKIAGEWDAKRKDYLEQTKDMYEEIIEIARLTIKEAKANPTPHNIYAMSKAIAALKQYQGVKVLEDETTPPEREDLSSETAKKVRELLGIDSDGQ
jgi:hypothetical protein